MVEKTKNFKKAFDIYVALSEMPVKSAIKKLQSMQQVSNDIKNVVITLINSQSHASQYIHDNFTPSEEDYLFNSTKYQSGSILGEYQLIEKIGQGGMSQVYKAKRSGVDAQKNVAIKIFSPKSFSPQLLEHFINEQKILANLSHPNIVNMLHGDKTPDGNVYLVMELIEQALPISKYAKKHKLSVKNKIKYILQCAKTLAYSHANLIIHRDLKPDNILINDKRQLKIVDFGIAKLISNDLSGDKTTILALTPSYAAPEQINSQHISVKTDIFSLAVVALELLNQKKFLPKDRLIKSCQNDEVATETTLKSLKIDKDLKNILRQALQQNPNDRYKSMQSFADDLQNYLYNKPVNATSQSFFYRLGKFSKRNKALFFTSLAFLVFLLGSLIFTLWQNQQIKIASAKAQHVKQFMLDTFSTTNPDEHSGEMISAKDLLLSAMRKIEENKKLASDVKLELYQSMGIAFAQLGLHKFAIQSFKSSLQIDPHNEMSLALLAESLFANKQQDQYQQLMQSIAVENFSAIPRIKLKLTQASDFIAQGHTQRALALLQTIEQMPEVHKHLKLQFDVQLLKSSAYFMQSDYENVKKTLNDLRANLDLPATNSKVLALDLKRAIMYKDSGEYEQALLIFTELEQRYHTVLGNDYPELGLLYLRMAGTLSSLGKRDKAKSYAQKSYDFYLRLYGEKGESIAQALNMLASLYAQDYQWQNAIEKIQHALKILNKSYAQDYPLVLDLKKNLANYYIRLAQYEPALEILQEIHAVQLKIFGTNNAKTLSTENSLMLAFLHNNQLEKAQIVGEKLLTKVKQELPKKHFLQTEARFNLSRVYFKMKKLHKRLDLLLEIEKNKLIKPTSPSYAAVLLTIGQAYDVLDEVKPAEDYFLKAITANALVYPANHINSLQIKLQYAKFLKYWKRDKKAKKITQQVKSIIAQENYHNATLDKWIKDLGY